MYLYFKKISGIYDLIKYLYYLCICTCSFSTWKKATDQWNLQYTCNYLMAMIVKQLQTSSAMAAAEVTLDEGRLLLSNDQIRGPWCDANAVILHGSLNVPIEHHPTIRYMVYNGYYKVMSNIPKMGQLPTPVLWCWCVALAGRTPYLKHDLR